MSPGRSGRSARNSGASHAGTARNRMTGRRTHAAVKRGLDWILAALGLCVLSPLFAAIAVWIRLDSPGSAFFRGLRAGRYGKDFEMLKFRTMRSVPAKGNPITVRDDPRITRAGRILRKLKMDELPQLINILRGEMSFVGPRPEDPQYVASYTPRQRQLLEYAPGLTSPGSILYRDEASLLEGEDWERVYCTEILPRKLEADLDYMARASVWSDLKVLAQTAGILTLDSKRLQK